MTHPIHPLTHLSLEVDLLFLDDCPLECEPMTQVISFYLDNQGIPHRKMIGSAQKDTAVIFPHCWIELIDGSVIDFRLRMWLQDSLLIPHGIFYPEKSGVQYLGGIYKAPPLALDEVKMLTDNKIMELL